MAVDQAAELLIDVSLAEEAVRADNAQEQASCMLRMVEAAAGRVLHAKGQADARYAIAKRLFVFTTQK